MTKYYTTYMALYNSNATKHCKILYYMVDLIQYDPTTIIQSDIAYQIRPKRARGVPILPEPTWQDKIQIT